MAAKKMIKKYSETGKMVDSTGKRFDYVYEEPEVKKNADGTKAPSGKDRTRGVHTVKIEVYNKIIEKLGVAIPDNGKDADEIADNKITETVKIGNDFMNTALDYYLANFDLITAGAVLTMPKPKSNK